MCKKTPRNTEVKASRSWALLRRRIREQMGLPQLLSPSNLDAAQASIQAGGDGVRDGVAMILTAIAEYTDMEGADGVNGSQVDYRLWARL